MALYQEWIKELKNNLEKFNLLQGDELEIYLLLLTSEESFKGSIVMEMIPHLTRTHTYALLNKLETEGWIEITNPGERPSKYRGLDPLRIVRQELTNQEVKLRDLKVFEEFIENTVIPNLTKKAILGGRITKTYIIPSLTDLIKEIKTHLNNAQFRISLHSSLNLISSFKEDLINNISRLMLRKYPNLDTIPFEYVRDQFAIIISDPSKSKAFSKKFPIPLAMSEREINYHVFIIDDTTFLTNLTGEIGITLRIQDQAVSSIYTLVLTQTLLDEMSQEIMEVSEEEKQLIYKEIPSLISAVNTLLDQGWQYFKSHSSLLLNEMGFIAPGPEKILFRLCGIRFFPFNEKESIETLVKKAFETMIQFAEEYIHRHEWHFVIETYKATLQLFGTKCLVLKVRYEMREDWRPIFGILPKLEMVDDNNAVPTLAVFNYKDKGAVCVWSLFNSENLLKILKILLE